MRLFRVVPVMLLITVLCSGMLFGQNRTRGSLSGVVEDSTGNRVANACVTIEGAYGTETVTTNDSGEFLFNNLIPAYYDLRVELTGFRTGNLEDTEVRLGETTTAVVTLQPGEVVSVVDIVDGEVSPVNPSTSIGANIPLELALAAPLERNVIAMVYAAPGPVDDLLANVENPSISGASGFENLTIIEDVDVTDPLTGATGVFNRERGAFGLGYNFDFVRQVEVKTGGWNASYGQALGGVITSVMKTGGNRYHGGIYAYIAPNQFEATQQQPNARRFNPGSEIRGQAAYDIVGEIGGYFWQDRVFWYGALNPTLNQYDVRAPEGFEMRVRGQMTENENGLNSTGKVTFQVAQNHLLEGTYFSDPRWFNSMPHVSLARDFITGPGEADSDINLTSRNVVARYTGAFGPWFTLFVNGSRAFSKFDETRFADVPLIQNIVPLQLGTGPIRLSGGIGTFENTRSWNNQFNATGAITWALMGDNVTEIGYQYEDFGADAFRSSSGFIPLFPRVPGAILPRDFGKPVFGSFVRRFLADDGDLLFQQMNGTFGPVPPIRATSRYQAAFIHNNIPITRYFSLVGGVRWEQQQLRGDPQLATRAGQERYTFAGNWAPRVGFVIDPSGINRTRIFFNWSKQFDKLPLTLAEYSLSGQASYLGLNFNSPTMNQVTYVAFDGSVTPQENLNSVAQSAFVTGGSIVPVLPGTRLQYQYEYVAGAEHSFTDENVLFGVRFIRRDLGKVVEDFSFARAEDVIAGNAVQNLFIGNPGGNMGFADPMRRYIAWEFTGQKRWQDVWLLQTGYRWATLRGNYEGLFMNTGGGTSTSKQGGNSINISSMYDFIPSPALGSQLETGSLSDERRHVGNLFIAHSFPEWGWNFGFGARVQSGTPISRLAIHPVYLTEGVIPVDGRGAFGRTPLWASFDAHVDYNWRLTDSVRIRPNLDVFNILNQQKEQIIDQRTTLAPGVGNPDFGQVVSMATGRSPYAFQRPLFVRVAVRVEF